MKILDMKMVDENNPVYGIAAYKEGVMTVLMTWPYEASVEEVKAVWDARSEELMDAQMYPLVGFEAVFTS